AESVKSFRDSPRRNLSDARKVHCPTLLIFGERDASQPVQKGVERVEQALKEGKNPDYLIKVIPNANHALQVLDGSARLAPAPGVDTLIADWILKRATVAK